MQTSLTDARHISLHEGEQPIPGYRVVRRRGRGGFGEVWEAEASGGFLVALKFVRLSNRARAAELRALEFVRGIHHPNLLANFGSWLVGDTLIIGMELADRSLWDRYVEAAQQGHRGIPRGELLGYLAEVAAGIDHLNDYRHTFDGRTSIGVQHRDLKPPNILLFGGGAKVADLGMARAMEGEVAGHTGVWTFPYAAPEFFRGETTRQSDQYGLAATFCQLRGGRLPFGGNAASVTAGHLFARPDLDALPEPERPIVERALAKVPGDRWPNCRAFVEALRALPADAVADILIDPDGPSSIPRESQSLDNGYYCSLGFATAGSGMLESGWSQPISSSGSSFDPGFDTGPTRVRGFPGNDRRWPSLLRRCGPDARSRRPLPSARGRGHARIHAAASPAPAARGRGGRDRPGPGDRRHPGLESRSRPSGGSRTPGTPRPPRRSPSSQLLRSRRRPSRRRPRLPRSCRSRSRRFTRMTSPASNRSRRPLARQPRSRSPARRSRPWPLPSRNPRRPLRLSPRRPCRDRPRAARIALTSSSKVHSRWAPSPPAHVPSPASGGLPGWRREPFRRSPRLIPACLRPAHPWR